MYKTKSEINKKIKELNQEYSYVETLAILEDINDYRKYVRIPSIEEEEKRKKKFERENPGVDYYRLPSNIPVWGYQDTEMSKEILKTREIAFKLYHDYCDKKFNELKIKLKSDLRKKITEEDIDTLSFNLVKGGMKMSKIVMDISSILAKKEEDNYYIPYIINEMILNSVIEDKKNFMIWDTKAKDVSNLYKEVYGKSAKVEFLDDINYYGYSFFSYDKDTTKALQKTYNILKENIDNERFISSVYDNIIGCNNLRIIFDEKEMLEELLYFKTNKDLEKQIYNKIASQINLG